MARVFWAAAVFFFTNLPLRPTVRVMVEKEKRKQQDPASSTGAGKGGKKDDGGGAGGSGQKALGVDAETTRHVVVPGPSVPEVIREEALKSSNRGQYFREYQRYSEEVDSYAKTAGGTVHKSSLKSYVNPEALRCALMARSLRKEDGSACADASEVSEEVLKLWLEPESKAAMLLSASDLADVFKRLSWRWTDPSWSDAISSLTERFMFALADKNHDNVLEESRLQKELVYLYVSKIYPAALHDPLAEDVARDKELRHDLAKFIDQARESAALLDKERIPHSKPRRSDQEPSGDDQGDGSQRQKTKSKRDISDAELLKEANFQPFKADFYRSKNQKKISTRASLDIYRSA